jgi:hypothetical protein
MSKTEQKKPVKQWTSFEPSKYEEVASDLAMFNSKLVNTNAPLTWIRLDSSSSLDLPYVSARTLMSRGCALPLDCAHSTQQKAYGQMCAREGDYEGVPEDEARMARQALEQARSTASSGNTSFVDHRLRQILLPKDGAKNGYVAVTPLPASGISQCLFGQEGLVRKHNAVVRENKENKEKKDDGDRKQVRIRMASINYGGSNPQNASSFTRSIQNSIFLASPSVKAETRRAFSLFYNGIRIDFNHDQRLMEALGKYADFRQKQGLDDSSSQKASSVWTRRQERAILDAIVRIVLDKGRAARSSIESKLDELKDGEVESIDDISSDLSVAMPLAVAGLITPKCRTHSWPLDLAKYILERMRAARKRNEHGQEYNLLVLDAKGERNVLNTLEECIRCDI